MRFLLLLTLLLALGTTAADASDLPNSWPVAFSEVFRVEAMEIRQIPLTWEGIQARRFHLRLTATEHFEASVTRVRDGSILFKGHFEPSYEVLIPWGLDEEAHLTLWSRRDEPQNIHLMIAIDPDEAGLEIYRFHLNRFLDYYEAGDKELARGALAAAVEEDPEDELTRLLWARYEDEAGYPDEEARVALAILRSRDARATGDPGTALGILQKELPRTSSEESRFELFRELAELNRELGNEHQVDTIVEQVLRESEDPERRAEAESWRN